MSNFHELAFNADRICEGLSKIGYNVESALLDIIDNSVAAQATNIFIDLQVDETDQLNSKSNVQSYTIIDDGLGMSGDQIKRALELGTEQSYDPGSLSKFGLGLKSAGFSLGRKVAVFSKSEKTEPNHFILDRDIIKKQNAYGIYEEEPSAKLVDGLAPLKQGTIVEISKPHSPQNSANKTIKELQRVIGVVYYHKMMDEKNPVKFQIRCKSKQYEINPIDILYLNDSYSEFDLATYDGKKPCRVFDNHIEHPENSDASKIHLQVVIFPKNQMHKHAGFTKAEREQIKKYDVGLKNSGYFFFRNERLIRWGDQLASLNRHFGFRAKVSFTDEHDDYLNVDVSKQNLDIPEKFEEILEYSTRLARTAAKDLFSRCDEILAAGDDSEGEEFSRRTGEFEEQDPDPATETSDRKKESKKRRKKLKKDTEETEGPEAEPSDSSSQEQGETATFNKVRYADNFTTQDLWKAGYHSDYGAFVTINKKHTFYQSILSPLDPSGKERQSIELLLWMSALGENKTREGCHSCTDEEIKKVFDKYRNIFSFNITSWLLDNQDLYS